MKKEQLITELNSIKEVSREMSVFFAGIQKNEITHETKKTLSLMSEAIGRIVKQIQEKGIQ